MDLAARNAVTLAAELTGVVLPYYVVLPYQWMPSCSVAVPTRRTQVVCSGRTWSGSAT